MGYVEIVRADGTVTRLGDAPVKTDYCDKCETVKPHIGGKYIEADGLKLIWVCLDCRVAERERKS